MHGFWPISDVHTSDLARRRMDHRLRERPPVLRCSSLPRSAGNLGRPGAAARHRRGDWDGVGARAPRRRTTRRLSPPAGTPSCRSLPRLRSASGLRSPPCRSLEPDATLWRGLGYACLPFVAWIIADLDADQWRRALAAGAGILVVSSLLVVVARPEWGTDVNDDWRGVMTNRNGLGPVCGLAVLAGISLLASNRRRSGGVLVLLSTLTLLGTGSRTAWFALLLAVGVASFVVVGRTVYVRTPERRVIAAALVSALAGAIAFVAAMTVMWGQSTFVQRRRIWDLVGDHISDSPIGGAGWGAFWYHPELHLDPLLQRGSAHGSIPELLLGGGVVALGLWLVVVAVAFTGVLRVAGTSRSGLLAVARSRRVPAGGEPDRELRALVLLQLDPADRRSPAVRIASTGPGTKPGAVSLDAEGGERRLRQYGPRTHARTAAVTR